MSFDYEKLKRKQVESESSWTSNSDLFMVLSLVFLLLYVVSSLRNGSSTVQKTIQYKELQKRNEDLEQQILAYEALKDDYLQKKASKNEMKMYGELMNKLSLLQDEAKVEKNDLRRKALENEKKENALNKYQQIIRNIVNTNLLSQGRIKKRDHKIKVQKSTILEKSETISQNNITIDNQRKDIVKKQLIIKNKEKVIRQKKIAIARKRKEVKTLKMDIYRKRSVIKKNNKKISRINEDLDKNIKRLNLEYKKHRHSKKQLSSRIAKLKKLGAMKIKSLKSINNQTKLKLSKVGKNLKSAQGQIEHNKRTMVKQSRERDKLSKKLLIKKNELKNVKDLHKIKIAKLKAEEKSKLNHLKSAHQKMERNLSKLKRDHKAKMGRERKIFDANLKKQRLSNKQKARELERFKSKMRNEEKAMNKKVAGLNRKIQRSKNKLSTAKRDLKSARNNSKRSLASVNTLKSKNQKLSKDLIQAKSLIDTRRKLARKIMQNLKKEGIKAQVNGKTGDVTISFGREYFDSGSSLLKKGMLKSLRKFIPTYSRSVFSDPKIAKKVAAVEVIGFASPTYKGYYVNPKSLKKKDQQAVRYNLKLSQGRANSVFNFMFDKEKLKYKYQKRLYPLVKVTGRSFITNEIKNTKKYKGMTNAKFCSIYDCKKAQRVIIKFSLKN